MPKLGVNTVVAGLDGVPLALAAGDDVPDWATDLVGEHLLAAEAADTGGRPAKNAKVEAWREHADSLGVTVADDATKADIIAAVDAHTAQQ